MKPESHIPTLEYEQKHPLLANPGETRALDHLPQLDGVRAIAVLLVLVHHLAPLKGADLPNLGALGVGLFFVLSGFLISRILLNCKLKIETGRATLGQMLKQFYMRRFLRIFPLYYGTIAVLWAVDLSGIRERVWWHVAYLSNYYFSFINLTRRGPDVPRERHFWSLSVEEQFYIVWPLLLMLVPRKWLLRVIVLTIVIAPAWRIIIRESTRGIASLKGSLAGEWMMPACLDLLGMGALLAILSMPAFTPPAVLKRFVRVIGWIGVPLFLGWATLRFFGRNVNVPGGVIYPVTALAGCWLVARAAQGFTGLFGRFLQWGPMVYTGRVSYGLYVLHMFVPHLFDGAWDYVGFAPANAWIRFVLLVAATYLIASVSWYAFEAPMNRLKKYFEYDGRKKDEG